MNTTCRIITYTLRDESGTSNGYFETIATFADGILSLFESALKPMITDFQHYLISRDDLPRSQPEYIFELLTLGVLWRVHAPLNTPRTLKGLEALIAHLALVGEFTQEVAHLQAWHGYLNTLSPSIVSQTLTRVIACAMEFEERAENALGRYTPNVEQFLSNEWQEHEDREDSTLRGRKRVEYHLNMVGTELLNRAFRQAFLAASRKVVLAPPCMRAKRDEECKAVKTAEGQLVCQGCTLDCRIHQLTQLGQKHGFEVYLIPDELRSLAARTVGGGSTVGVVGISCVLTNAPGGWEAQALDLPAQGLLLDYCGCSYHWDDQGFPTDTNFNKLLELLGLRAEKELKKRLDTSVLPNYGVNIGLDLEVVWSRINLVIIGFSFSYTLKSPE